MPYVISDFGYGKPWYKWSVFLALICRGNGSVYTLEADSLTGFPFFGFPMVGDVRFEKLLRSEELSIGISSFFDFPIDSDV